jgi:hypothetical protein
MCSEADISAAAGKVAVQSSPALKIATINGT